MSRRREWTKRLNRTQWFAAYRATRDRLAYGVSAVEVVYLARRGKRRVVRIEHRPYSAKYGGDSERLHTYFELKFADGISEVLRTFQDKITRLQNEFASTLDSINIRRGSFAVAQAHTASRDADEK